MTLVNTRSILLLVAAALGIVILPLFGSEPLIFSDLGNPESLSYRILFDLRAPRIVLLFIVGGSLAMLGGTYQILFHNPLAEPYVLGISSAVTLGAVISEVFFHASPGLSLSGMAAPFALALAVTTLLLLISFSKFGREPERVVLFGMGLNFLLSSLLFLLLSYYSQQMGGGSMRWLFGHIPWVSRSEVLFLFLAAIPFIGGMLILSRHLDALSLGDTVARTLGVSPVVSRNLVLLTTSLFIAALVSITGSIGFLGLIVPHAARLIFRPSNTRLLLGFSFLIGALFLAVADVSARTILPPFEFPIGILTTLLGAPPFLYLLWKR